MRMRPPSLGRGLHGLILGFPVTLFSLGLITDVTYLKTAELQWSNFSAWSIVGGLIFGGLAFLWSLFDLIRARSLWLYVYSISLFLMCVLGLINAFKHSQDGWSSVGALGVSLSVLCCGLALVAGLVRYSGISEEGTVR